MESQHWLQRQQASYPAADPGAYLYLDNTGHPGRGSDDVTGNVDRFAIAAYTIQPAKEGLISIANSSISTLYTGGNGVELRVYVNDTLKTEFVQVAGATASSFDLSLGTLKAGDVVYVAVGPNAQIQPTIST